MFVVGDQVARHIKEINSFSEGLGFDCGVLITRMHLEKMLLPKSKDEKNHIQAIRTRRPSLSLNYRPRLWDCKIFWHADVNGWRKWRKWKDDERCYYSYYMLLYSYVVHTLFIRCSSDVWPPRFGAWWSAGESSCKSCYPASHMSLVGSTFEATSLCASCWNILKPLPKHHSQIFCFNQLNQLTRCVKTGLRCVEYREVKCLTGIHLRHMQRTACMKCLNLQQMKTCKNWVLCRVDHQAINHGFGDALGCFPALVQPIGQTEF